MQGYYTQVYDPIRSVTKLEEVPIILENNKVAFLSENYVTPQQVLGNYYLRKEYEVLSEAEKHLRFLDEETPGFMKCAVEIQRDDYAVGNIVLDETIRIARDPVTREAIGIRQGAQEGIIYRPSKNSDWFHHQSPFDSSTLKIRFIGFCKATYSQKILNMK